MPEREVKYMLLVVFEVEPDDADSSLFLSNQQLDKFPSNTFRFFFLFSSLLRIFIAICMSIGWDMMLKHGNWLLIRFRVEREINGGGLRLQCLVKRFTDQRHSMKPIDRLLTRSSLKSIHQRLIKSQLHIEPPQKNRIDAINETCIKSRRLKSNFFSSLIFASCFAKALTDLK